MRNNGEFDRREEIGSETSSFIFVPCESCFMISNEVVHQVSFFGPKEIARVIFVDNRFSFERISRRWGKRWGMRIELWHVFERIASNVSNDAKSIGKGCNDWSSLLGNWFVFLLRRCEDWV